MKKRIARWAMVAGLLFVGAMSHAETNDPGLQVKAALKVWGITGINYTDADLLQAINACSSYDAARTIPYVSEQKPGWAATCAASLLSTVGSLKTFAASGATALYLTTTAQIATRVPAVVEGIPAKQSCPAGTVPNHIHTVAEKPLMASGMYNYCSTPRSLAIVGFVESSAIKTACGASMQPAVPKSSEEQQMLSALMKWMGQRLNAPQSGFWMGGAFNTGTNAWTWPDGMKITEWPEGKALTAADYNNGGGSLCVTPNGATPWGACGAPATHIAICESMLTAASAAAPPPGRTVRHGSR